MKVSVIIATYHRDETLNKAIQSVIDQTYPDVEIVVVSDNADSQWNEIVRSIVNDFKNITYIENEQNRGSAETRNIGIRAAKGDYITFLDDDDVYLPDRISHQLIPMVDNNADYCITDLLLFDENDKQIDKRIRSYTINLSYGSLLKYHLMYHLTGTDTMMFKKCYLTRIGGFSSINVGDEFYLMEKAICGGGKYLYVPGCNVKAYVHSGKTFGLSSGQSKIDGENQLYDFKKKKYFQEIDSKCRRYIRMRHYAVLAFAEYRQKNWLPFIMNMVKCEVSAPFQCIGMVTSHKLR